MFQDFFSRFSNILQFGQYIQSDRNSLRSNSSKFSDPLALICYFSSISSLSLLLLLLLPPLSSTVLAIVPRIDEDLKLSDNDLRLTTGHPPLPFQLFAPAEPKISIDPRYSLIRIAIFTSSWLSLHVPLAAK